MSISGLIGNVFIGYSLDILDTLYLGPCSFYFIFYFYLFIYLFLVYGAGMEDRKEASLAAAKATFPLRTSSSPAHNSPDFLLRKYSEEGEK